jgi:bifunctional non-homologous end joining protein LigD
MEEIIVIKDGRSNFGELQADLAPNRKDRLSLYLFDLLYLEGLDRRRSPLIERKRILKSLFDETKPGVPVVGFDWI